MTPIDDNLLTALHAARPTLHDHPDAASPEAQAMLARILEPAARPRPALLRLRRRALVLAGLPAAGAVAAVALALAMTAPGPAAPPHGPRPTASAPTAARAPGSRSAASVRTAVLDAFNQVSDDIVYTRQTVRYPHAPVITSQEWTYPAMQTAGHQVRVRVFVSYNGVPSEDTESVYVAGPSADHPPSDRPTPEPTTGGPRVAQITDVEYATHTWSRLLSSTPLLGGSVNPAAIRQQIADRAFTVVGPARVQGRRAVELTWTLLEGPPGSHNHGVTTRLWVDARTYIPLQAVSTNWFQPPGRPRTIFLTATLYYRILRPTPANLALLNPPIPAGFTRTATSPHYAPVAGGQGRR